jgi:hypothetical protein
MTPSTPVTLKVTVTAAQLRFLEGLVREGRMATKLDYVVQFLIADEIRRWENINRRSFWTL